MAITIIYQGRSYRIPTENIGAHIDIDAYAEIEKENKRLKEQNRWIPVSERLPEEDIDYTILAWADEGEQCFVYEADCVDGKFFTMTGHELHWITHWKLLTKPLQEKANE